MEKRGISPLIATVLIIGFTIVIGSMVMIWGGDIFEKVKSGSEERAITQLTCTTKINLNIKEACNLGSSIRFGVENIADQKIESFITRIISPSGADINSEKEIGGASKTLSPFEYKIFTQNYVSYSTTPTKLEILPRILIDNEERTCPGTAKEIKPCYILPSINNLNDWEGETGLIQDNPDMVALLESAGLLDKSGIYNDGASGPITISSKEFVIPQGVSSFFVRILINSGNYNYKLADSDGGTLASGGCSSNCNVNGVVADEFVNLDSSNIGKTVKLVIEKTEGYIGIVNLGYVIT